MDHPHEPMDAIKKWQEWYKQNRIIAEMDTPLISKQSRENLHNTTKVATLMSDVLDQEQIVKNKQKAEEYFLDTIAEFANELSGKDLYEALIAAANHNLSIVKKEYDQAQEFASLVQGNNYGTK
jgi:hypothetical protein